MSLPKEKFRELAFQMLYGKLNGQSDESISFYMSQLKTTRQNVISAKEYIEEVLKHQSELDEQIDRLVVGYDLDRIHSVERAILLLLSYEILHNEQVPDKVAISEGMRLAKKFSGEKAVKFINAILDQIAKSKG